MSAPDRPPEIFDRRRRRALRMRAKYRGNASFMWDLLADELAERLSYVSRDFRDVLILGPMTSHAAHILSGRGTNLTIAAEDVEEDRLPYPENGFDLVISAGTLDGVNDLPGALIQIRRALRPDGLFLGHMFGAGTLAALKSAMLLADGDSATPHIHPQIDLRSAADLLSRAGFALPVADQDASLIRYGDWRTLVNDLRDMGLGNALSGHRHYQGHQWPQRLDSIWADATGDGKVEEQFIHLHLSGWAPSADQPKPAKRGSGTVSLASILKPPPKD